MARRTRTLRARTGTAAGETLEKEHKRYAPAKRVKEEPTEGQPVPQLDRLGERESFGAAIVDGQRAATARKALDMDDDDGVGEAPMTSVLFLVGGSV
ncbi:uncharacterized protein B0H18DRAFT_1121774 [Fomitopsis serialis]|uniref:uncharacterized protein n=1 Tax=Fomitopsis serialis TaxID=139415 RepID=UPI0020078490|nr:uncharacterized protein B0H18DRAFT_1121774 [Neoantrodia serialis]KAH9920677.1 hypothetical protein B0H18DRAFT_1121774 [Neoantrodia serialis]